MCSSSSFLTSSHLPCEHFSWLNSSYPNLIKFFSWILLPRCLLLVLSSLRLVYREMHSVPNGNWTEPNPSPLDQWLIASFEHAFGNDPQVLRAFEADLYPTNQTMTFSGEGKLIMLLNQTSLSPPQISITAGRVSLSGNFTFVPTFVNSTIVSVPNSLNSTVFNANAAIPLWSYNMVKGILAYLPTSTTIDYPHTFLELINYSGWIAGNETVPRTPSAFASQQYGFWPLGVNLTIYANLQGGGIKLLGTQKVGPNEYQASFYIDPWSGGVSSVQLIGGDTIIENESALNKAAYPSPLPQALTGLYTVSYSATGLDTRVVFRNAWEATTIMDLGAPATTAPLVSLLPATTATAFGIAMLLWIVVSGMLKTRRMSIQE